MVFPDAVRENQEGVPQTLLCLGIAFDVDPLLLRPGHLEEDAVFVLLHLRFTLFERAAYAWHLSSAQVSRTQASTCRVETSRGDAWSKPQSSAMER